MTRKQIARTFLRLAATGQVRAAYERFVGRGFVHHNPYFPADAASLRRGMEAHPPSIINADQPPSVGAERQARNCCVMVSDPNVDAGARARAGA